MLALHAWKALATRQLVRQARPELVNGFHPSSPLKALSSGTYLLD